MCEEEERAILHLLQSLQDGIRHRFRVCVVTLLRFDSGLLRKTANTSPRIEKPMGSAECDRRYIGRFQYFRKTDGCVLMWKRVAILIELRLCPIHLREILRAENGRDCIYGLSAGRSGVFKGDRIRRQRKQSRQFRPQLLRIEKVGSCRLDTEIQHDSVFREDL